MRVARAFFLLLIAASAACDLQTGGQVAAQTAPEAARVDVRRVWSGNDFNFYAASPSPDGRSMSEIDWSNGDLAIVDLETAKRRKVTDKGPWSVAVDYAENSVFSPDGQRLAYSWFREGSGYQLRVIGVDGTNERILVPHSEDLRYIAAEDWSPDGEQILVTVFRRDRSSQIATVSAETGELRVLKTSDWRHPVVSAFSRDSRFIAFDFQPDEEDRQRDIFVLRADGGREARVVGGPSDDILLGWLPDGSGILFYSDRHQTRGIWKQPIRGGLAEGEPQLVRPDVWQLTPLGFSRDAYFYGVLVRSPQVYTMTVDQAANRVVVEPAAVQDPSAGETEFGAWSADGRYFGYLRELPDFSQWLVIRSVDGADTREVRVDLDDNPRHIQWDPDGRSVLMVGTDPEGRIGIHRVDIRTGDMSVVVQVEETQPGDAGRFRLSPDGRSILYWKPLDGTQRGVHKNARMVMRDLATGDERPLHEVQNPGPAFFSPDGSMYVKMEWDSDTRIHSLFVARADGVGERRTIYETQNGLLQNRGGFPFTPDGRYVIAAEHRREPQDVRLLKIPVDGGDPIVLLTWTESRMADLRMSPDGRRISFGSGEPLGEIWVLENLGPAGPATGSVRQ